MTRKKKIWAIAAILAIGIGVSAWYFISNFTNETNSAPQKLNNAAIELKYDYSAYEYDLKNFYPDKTDWTYNFALVNNIVFDSLNYISLNESTVTIAAGLPLGTYIFSTNYFDVFLSISRATQTTVDGATTVINERLIAGYGYTQQFNLTTVADYPQTIYTVKFDLIDTDTPKIYLLNHKTITVASGLTSGIYNFKTRTTIIRKGYFDLIYDTEHTITVTDLADAFYPQNNFKINVNTEYFANPVFTSSFKFNNDEIYSRYRVEAKVYSDSNKYLTNCLSTVKSNDRTWTITLNLKETYFAIGTYNLIFSLKLYDKISGVLMNSNTWSDSIIISIPPYSANDLSYTTRGLKSEYYSSTWNTNVKKLYEESNSFCDGDLEYSDYFTNQIKEIYFRNYIPIITKTDIFDFTLNSTFSDSSSFRATIYTPYADFIILHLKTYVSNFAESFSLTLTAQSKNFSKLIINKINLGIYYMTAKATFMFFGFIENYLIEYSDGTYDF